MKVNTSKLLSVTVCCFVFSLRSEVQCMEIEDWVSKDGNTRWVTIISKDGKALDSWDYQNDTVGAVTPCNTCQRQLWKIEKVQDNRYLGSYYITSKDSDKCLDSWDSESNGIGKAPKNLNKNDGNYKKQLWEIGKKRDGYYFITSMDSGKRLDSWDSGSNEIGKALANPSDSYPKQLWMLNIVNPRDTESVVTRVNPEEIEKGIKIRQAANEGISTKSVLQDIGETIIGWFVPRTGIIGGMPRPRSGSGGCGGNGHIVGFWGRNTQ